MKIFEIDDADRVRAKLSGINLDIDSVYDNARLTVHILKGTTDPIFQQVCRDTLVEIANQIQRVIDTAFADDVSTQELKHKAQLMIINIQKYL